MMPSALKDCPEGQGQVHFGSAAVVHLAFAIAKGTKDVLEFHCIRVVI